MSQEKTSGKKRRKGWIFVLSGPSGAGKTTLLEKLLGSTKINALLAKSISWTTRPKRPAEKNGRDYFFISPAEFRRGQAREKILEWTKFLGYYYATPRDFVEKKLREGKFVLLCLDTVGAKKIKQLYPDNTVTIFIVPPSLDALRERIRARKDNAGQPEIVKRLSLADGELKAARDYDYRVVNRQLTRAVKRLQDIILKYDTDKVNKERR